MVSLRVGTIDIEGAKIDCLSLFMCPLLAQLIICFFSFFLLQLFTVLMKKVKQSIIFRCLWLVPNKLFQPVIKVIGQPYSRAPKRCYCTSLSACFAHQYLPEAQRFSLFSLIVTDVTEKIQSVCFCREY
jgi:hypothetical protein